MGTKAGDKNKLKVHIRAHKPIPEKTKKAIFKMVKCAYNQLEKELKTEAIRD